MALILNLETATTMCSVALARDGHVVALKEQSGGYSHSENLGTYIQEVLASEDISPEQLDAVSVSKGPGSYTGLRIGASMAKGLCYSNNIPLMSVSTLKSMANMIRSDFDGDSWLCPMIDARRMEVYSAIFTSDLVIKKDISADIIEKGIYDQYLENETVVFFGDGALKCKELLDHPNAIFVEDKEPSAESMASLSEEAFQSGTFEDTAYFEPYYLKEFVAIKAKNPLA